jgi:cytoplasmic iron level regulating protein YaaA (DUF328/UPF0246 family)
MQIIISPAKSIDFNTDVTFQISSNYRFTNEAEQIAAVLKTYTPKDLSSLMKISQSLADLNYTRFQNWHFPFTKDESRQAIFAFKGDVYTGLDTSSLSNDELNTTQKQLRILSGLYGLLRPFDLILAYRLEMGTKLSIKQSANLYKFWGTKITALLNKDIEESNHRFLINLASNEYYKAIQAKKIQVPIITPTFKEWKNGQYKIVSFYAKKARGLITRFIIQNQITNPEDLKAFDSEGYYYNNELSTKYKPVFTRDL